MRQHADGRKPGPDGWSGGVAASPCISSSAAKP
jgi:hypothetical protein